MEPGIEEVKQKQLQVEAKGLWDRDHSSTEGRQAGRLWGSSARQLQVV